MKKAEKIFLQKTDLPGQGRSVFLKRGVGRGGREEERREKKGRKKEKKKLRRKGRKGRKAYF